MCCCFLLSEISESFCNSPEIEAELQDLCTTSSRLLSSEKLRKKCPINTCFVSCIGILKNGERRRWRRANRRQKHSTLRRVESYRDRIAVEYFETSSGVCCMCNHNIQGNATSKRKAHCFDNSTSDRLARPAMLLLHSDCEILWNTDRRGPQEVLL